MAGLFNLKEQGATVGRELIAGTTTFLTMAYILFVNPDILSKAGMDRGACLTATVLATAAGTLLCALWAKVPFAMAPGMGLNAMFTYSLVLGRGMSWQTALGAVFLSGTLFLILTLVNVRAKLVEAIPLELRLAVPAGIGLFIAFIGLRNMGLVVASDATLVTLGPLTETTLFALAGLLVAVILSVLKVPGAMLLGMAATTIVGLVAGKASLPSAVVSLPHSPLPVLLKLDVFGALSVGTMGAVFSLMFVDLFDSIGTILACSYGAGLVRDDGTVERLNPMLSADATATMVGALLGTSTTTTYIESGAGVAAGGRTGLTAIVTAVLFLLTLLFTPLIEIVPSYAIAPALVVVGAFMFKDLREISFEDFRTAFPAYLTMLLMPFTFSISIGLAFGFLSYVLLHAVTGQARKVHPVMWGIAVFSLVDLVLSST